MKLPFCCLATELGSRAYRKNVQQQCTVCYCRGHTLTRPAGQLQAQSGSFAAPSARYASTMPSIRDSMDPWPTVARSTIRGYYDEAKGGTRGGNDHIPMRIL